jgi:hypothetical protein
VLNTPKEVEASEKLNMGARKFVERKHQLKSKFFFFVLSKSLCISGWILCFWRFNMTINVPYINELSEVSHSALK